METEHKQKISEAKIGHLVSQKTKDKISATLKNKYNNGLEIWNKGIQMPEVQEENHYKWKGGTRQTARAIVKRNNIDTSYCRICKEKKKTLIHHIDGNESHNELKNLAIICISCHSAIHGHGLKTRFQKGHKISEENFKKLKPFNIGHTPWNKGLKINKEDYPNWGNTQKQIEVMN